MQFVIEFVRYDENLLKFKSMKKYILPLLLLSLLAFSCSITEEIHFNKNFSGDFTYKFDLSKVKSFASMMKMGDSSAKGQDFNFDEFGKMKDSIHKSPLGQIEGISDFKSDFDPSGVLSISFKFNDLEALNKIYGQLNFSKFMDEKSMKGMTGGTFTPGAPDEGDSTAKSTVLTNPSLDNFVYFKAKGKELLYRRPKAQVNNKEMDDAMKSMEMLQGMGNIFDYQTIITFDRKVKKVNSKNISASQNDQDVTIKMDLQQLTKQDKEPEVQIKLK